MTKTFLCSVFMIFFALIAIQTVDSQEITEVRGLLGNRYYHNDEKIQKRELESILSNNPEALPFYQKSKSKQTLKEIASLVDFGFLVWVAAARNQQRDNINERDFRIIGPWLGGILATGVVWGFRKSSNKYRTMAIEAYNGSVDSLDYSYFEIISIANGIGIRYVF